MDIIGGGGGISGYGWPINSQHPRFKIMTIFVICGFLISLLKIRYFKYAFLNLGFLGSTLLFLGSDDIFFLKKLSERFSVQFLRSIVLIDFFAILLSAIGLYYITFSLIYLLKKFNIKLIFSYIVILLIICSVFYPIYKERYQYVQKEITFISQASLNKLNGILRILSEKPNGRFWFSEDRRYNINYSFKLPRHYLISSTSTSSLYKSRALILPVYKRFPYKKNLLNLFNIQYIISDLTCSWLSDKKYSIDPRIFYTDLIAHKNGYVIFKIKEKYKYCDFLKRKPILVFANAKQWFYLNRWWIKDFAEEKTKNIFLVKARANNISESKDINFKKFKAILFLDFCLGDGKKTSQKLKNYIKEGGTILSFKPLPELKSQTITSNHNLYQQLEKLYSNTEKHDVLNNSFIDELLIDSDHYLMKVFTDSDRFLLFKINYFDNWKVKIDNKSVLTYRISPMFIAIYIPKGKHSVEFHWQKSKIQCITNKILFFSLFVIGIFGIKNCIIKFKKL